MTDQGLNMSELGTHNSAIGDLLPLHWGLTLSLLGTYFLAIGDVLQFIPNKVSVNPQSDVAETEI